MMEFIKPAVDYMDYQLAYFLCLFQWVTDDMYIWRRTFPEPERLGQ